MTIAEPHVLVGLVSQMTRGPMGEDPHSQVEGLLRLFAEHNLDELVIEDDSLKVHLRRSRPRPRTAVAGRARRAPIRLPPAPRRRARTVAVRAPLTGVFYRAPGPEAPPFVEIGDVVAEGQTVCIVEAMKVFNEIKAEWPGRVVAIPAENGRLVQPGEPLVVLEFLPEETSEQE